MNRNILIAIAIASLLILVGVVGVLLRYASLGDPSTPPSPVPQTPTSTATSTDNDFWKTFTDPASGVSFSYPARLLPEFITAPVWPPRVRVATGTLSCVEKLGDRGESTVKRMVDNRSYCITQESEGAAGSVYTTYTYQIEKEGKVITLDFTLRAVQCANYDEPKRTACGEEREAFDLDSVIDRIIESVKIGR